MLEQIGSIIVKYWVELLLSLVVAGGGFLIKRYWRLEQEQHQREQQEFFDKMLQNFQTGALQSLANEHIKMNQISDERYQETNERIDDALEESREDDKKIEQEVGTLQNQISALTAGVLSMQGKEFRNACRKLLAEEHIITLDEWEEITKDHFAYNGLGGNHKGDELFTLVEIKFKSGLADDQRPV